MTRWLIAIALLSTAGAACHRGASDAASARPAVQRFFQLAEAGDCARLQPMLADPNDCENLVRQFTETKTHLVSIDKEQPDGRDVKTMMVFTTVVFGKNSNHKWVVRARRVDDAWKLRL